MFKYIFAFLGYYFLGFFGAFIGYLIGSSIDRAKDYGIGGINPLGTGQRRAVFLETIFVLMGKLAKSDGHISKDEITHVEQFIKKNGMSAEHRQQAIDQFKRGSATDFDITAALDQFMAVCGHTLHLKQVLLMYLTVMALADGKLDQAEQSLLEEIALHLGYSRAEFKQMLDMVLNQSHFAHGSTSSASALEDAYKALGVTKDNTDQEIKRAYRKLISQYHPDKLIGQGLPEDMIAVATEQAKEIQVAYDLIKKQHNNR
ncbi:MAG: co-chaperone DjlA [Gammaproteobacteria bacterium]|nr:MAG: co-chaperone DjlA [Gammaproteobacteria bacterium]